MLPHLLRISWSAIALIAAGAVVAQPYPNRPIRIITPFGPGNAGDIIPRAIAPHMIQTLKANIVMDNRPGAGGNIASEIVARGVPDGYTLLFATIGTHGINPNIYPKLAYDPIKDFAPISLAASSPNLLVLNPAVPAKSVKELIALAKSNPGSMNFGSSGVGTSVHLSGELFNTLAGVKTVHIPYKGASEALTDLIAGRTQFIFASMSSSINLAKSGKLRALAVTSGKRHPALPDVPTMQEAGVPGFEAVAWFGYVAPAGTPLPIVKTLNESIIAALNDNEVKERLFGFGVDPLFSTPAEFGAFIRNELGKWARVVKASGAKAN
jgi:tripartite-type tricarboxylate transporter receptor subunit TctC